MKGEGRRDKGIIRAEDPLPFKAHCNLLQKRLRGGNYSISVL